MPYTDDPANVPADEVRFLVGDTSTTSPELTDRQVAFLLTDEGGNARRAAARAAEVLSAKYSQSADEKQVGPLRLKFAEKASRYASLAKTLWVRASSNSVTPYAGGISHADKAAKEGDPDRVAPTFTRRLMEYPNGTPQQASPEELLDGTA